MVSLARLLLQPKADWEKTKSKGKVPKPTMDTTIAAIAMDVLQMRLREYPASVEVRGIITCLGAQPDSRYRTTKSFSQTSRSSA